MSLTLLVLLVAPQGATVFVPDNFPTIQGALTASAAGDTVIVRPGTYFEAAVDMFGKDIVLRSEKGPAVTTIDGMGLDSVIALQGGETAAAVIDGFTITNGSKWDGGGISIEEDTLGNPSSPTVRNCVFENNIGVGGAGGIHVSDASTSLFENCLIQNNITVNYYGAGGAIFDSNPTFINCTIRDNTAPNWGGGFAVWGTSQITMLNCVMSGNSPDNFTYVGGPPPTPILEYTLVEGDTLEPWFSATCMDADPLYATGPAGSAYLSHLAAGQAADSPCIDAGDPATAGWWVTRTDGGFDVGVADMGYHYPIDGPELVVGELVSGAVNTLEIRNNQPGDVCLFGYSLFGGGPFPSAYGTVYLTQPYTLAATVAADLQGVATLTQAIPPVAANRDVWLQGLNQAQLKLTNPLAKTIQ